MTEKNKVKIPLLFKTAVVLFAVYLLVMAIVTGHAYTSMNEEFFSDSRKQAQELKRDIKACRYSNTGSTAYEGDLNRAEAAAVLRWYNYQLQRKYHDKGGKVDISVFEIEKDKKGNIKSISELKPAVTVLIGSPLYKNSKIIVPADSFSGKNLEKIEKELRGSGYFEMSGWQDGRFFYPDRIVLDEEGNKAAVSDVKKKTGVYKKNACIQDEQTVFTDGTISGYYEDEKPIEKKYHEQVKKSLEEEHIGTKPEEESGGYYTPNEAQITEVLPGERYIVSYASQASFLVPAMKSLKAVYLISLFILAAALLILAMIQSRFAERNFESEGRRRVMMDAIAHELKTPLGVIRNVAEFLADEEDPGKRRYYSHAIIEEADSMNDEIITMLETTKLEAGTYPMELSEFSLRVLAEEKADNYAALIGEKDLCIDLEMDEEINLYADRKLTGYVISNYISNAVRNAEPGSRIKIRIEKARAGRATQISISDIGTIVPKRDLEKIWDAYYKEDPKTGRKGNGLGLTIVRNVCHLHGGRCGCYAEKNGMTFWAILPQQDDTSRAEARTGRVLNLSYGQMDLSGLDTFSYGFGLQAIATLILFVGLVILSVMSGQGKALASVGIQSVIQYCYIGLIIVSCLLMSIGSVKLKRNNPQAKHLMVTCIVTAVVTGLVIINAAISKAIFAAVIMFSFEFALLPVLIAVFASKICYDAAIDAEDRLFAGKIKRSARICIALMIIIAILETMITFWSVGTAALTVMCIAGCGIVSLVLVWLWMKTYRNYNAQK